jgi:chloride channel 7
MLWFALLFSGFCVGLIVFLITESLLLLTDIKLSIVHANHDHFLKGASLFILVNAFLAFLATALVTYVSPLNAGSGLPETKALLNGTPIPTFLRWKTLLTKILSITLVVASGFPVGKEGPMVHIGAAVCAGILNAHLFNRHRNDMASAVEATAAGFHRKSTFATIGGAAGIAAAFNAPIGGILYVFEELSTFWSPETTFKAFAVCAFASLSAQILLHGADTGSKQLESHVIFNVVDHTSVSKHQEGASYTVHGWTYMDLPFFFLLAIICALLSSCYTALAVKLNTFRARAKYRKTKGIRVLEVVVMNIVVNLFYLSLPLALPCKTIPEDAKEDNEIELSPWSCSDSENEYNPIATLFFGGEETALKQMLGSTAHIIEWDTGVLVLFTTVYYALSVMSCGMSMPLGTFIPQVVAGSVVGRIMGEFVHKSTNIDVTLISGPGTYAFVGAGAMLAGFTRMTCAIAVILVEASGAIGLSVPVMLSIIVSRGAADAMCEPFDEQMLELKGYEFVYDEPEKGTEMLVAGDIMSVVPTLRESSTAGVIKYALKKCPAAVDAMPIMCDEGHVLLGLIDKRALTEHLIEMVDEAKKNHWGDEEWHRDHDHDEHGEKEGSNHGGNAHAASRRFSAFVGVDATSLFVPKSNDKSFGPGARRSSLMVKISGLDEMKEVRKYAALEVSLTHLVEQCPYTALTHMPITRVQHLFRRMDLKHLAVVDSENRIKGLISRHNLLAKRTHAECKNIAENSTNHIEHAIEMSIRRREMMGLGDSGTSLMGGGRTVSEERVAGGLVQPPPPPSPGLVGLAAARKSKRDMAGGGMQLFPTIEESSGTSPRSGGSNGSGGSGNGAISMRGNLMRSGSMTHGTLAERTEKRAQL